LPTHKIGLTATPSAWRGATYKPRQKILYAGAELNRLYPRYIISMSDHAV
jgi:hypothetical protein